MIGETVDADEDMELQPVTNSMAMITGHAYHEFRLDDDTKRAGGSFARPVSSVGFASRAGRGLPTRLGFREKLLMGRTAFAIGRA
jgi:hypothetical protein